MDILQEPLQCLEALKGDVGILAADAEERVGSAPLVEVRIAKIVVQGVELDSAEHLILHLQLYLLAQLGIATDNLPQKRQEIVKVEHVGYAGESSRCSG